MKLSLSVRIVEAPCKSRLQIPVEEVVQIARDTGYSAICMRASAAGVGTPHERLEQIRQTVQQHGLFVSMVTADVHVPLNNTDGPGSLRNIGPSLEVAEALQCSLIRVCMKHPDDIPWARRAAAEAGERGIRLAHQCHTASLFEEVDGMLDVLKSIGSRHFGLICEPANLLLCGQPYGRETLQRLQPYLMNVYVQNHQLNSAGTDELPTFCRGPVRFDHLDPWTPGGIDFEEFCGALHAVGYHGTLTIHQAQGIADASSARAFADRCARYFLPLVSGISRTTNMPAT